MGPWWPWLALACRPVLAPVVPPPSEDPWPLWDAVLGDVVTVDGLVDYDALEARRDPLDAYVAWVAKPRRHVPDGPRHAFWINTYNALVLFAVLQDGRPASVKDVDGWIPVPGSGFFYERAFVVEGRATSLWEIEHELVRFRGLDFRAHASLNCASMSCPPMRPGLFRVQGIAKQLDDQMRRWLADRERGLRVEPDEAVFSQLFDTFAYDLALTEGGRDPCAVAADYRPDPDRTLLLDLSARGCPRTFMDYDGSLNDGSGRAVRRDQRVPEPTSTLRTGAAPQDTADPVD